MSDRRRVDRLLPFLIFAALVAAPILLELAGQGFYVKLVTRIAILALAALALDFVVGFAGMVSLGHAAFIGIGAYAIGILSEHGIVNGWLQFATAILGSALVAVLIGIPSLRTRGVQFIMITLAFAQMLYFVAVGLGAYGGEDGLTLWNLSEFGGLVDLGQRTQLCGLAVGILLVTYLGLRHVVGSRFGRVLRAGKANERRMAALGYDVTRYRLAGFALSGAITGLAGALLANHNEFVSPSYMSWHRSGELLVMVILGGLGTLHGAILGAAAFLLLEELLADVTQHWHLIFGPLLVLVVIRARGGIVGSIRGRPAGW